MSTHGNYGPSRSARSRATGFWLAVDSWTCFASWIRKNFWMRGELSSGTLSKSSCPRLSTYWYIFITYIYCKGLANKTEYVTAWMKFGIQKLMTGNQRLPDWTLIVDMIDWSVVMVWDHCHHDYNHKQAWLKETTMTIGFTQAHMYIYTFICIYPKKMKKITKQKISCRSVTGWALVSCSKGFTTQPPRPLFYTLTLLPAT